MSVRGAVTEAKFSEALQFANDSSENSKLQRRHSKALSLSSLSDESSKDTNFKAFSNEACRDVERELEALKARLHVLQRRRQHQNTSQDTITPCKIKMQGASVGPGKIDHALMSISSSAPLIETNYSSTVSTLSKAQQEAEAVADQVATTLKKCDQLLLRAKSCDTTCASSVNKLEDCIQQKSNAITVPNSYRLSDSAASDVSSIGWDGKYSLASEDQEALLGQKVASVKRFAARCHRNIAVSNSKIALHQQQTQAAYLKELQRKFESKKQITLMALREKYETETKALVKAKMEEFEDEEASAVKMTREALIDERNRALEEIQTSHNAVLEECITQLSLQTEREKKELLNRLQDERSRMLIQIQSDNDSSLRRWEVEQRDKLEKEMYEHREAAVATALQSQEERTAVLKQEIQASHVKKEEEELQKLKKALAFGAHAQLQQLRKLLETEHIEKVQDIENEARLALDKELENLKQMLQRSYQEQQEQLKRDLDKKTRVAVMDLHDTMQIAQRDSLNALRAEAEQHKAQALASFRQESELKCRKELQELEQSLQQEMSAKLRQLERNHIEECELKLEQLRTRAVNLHARELEAKRSRMIQCKNVLLDEATAFLTFDNKLSDDYRNKAHLVDKSAAAHLSELKKHLSKELARYVTVMVSEFDELAEEHQILVAKITESTQLYLSFKRQCGVFEAQTAELSSGIETLNEQLQRKDAVCKELYLANEALLKRVQTPATETSMVKGET
ncbi:uncharacterized protein PHALS_11570 [Plasmopara halstedii]|uniref:Uncharacterized protein n=1 Tax=Plasmopara halstedii TaxID=4781 RepID=A0A0P1AK16_PLAHL|nr:uncharacterized protein PHALS_11570 [Plasmopara halstedii]CEG41207.1 hypothetical protein PHALS_11570 [Plasmopara halstedii]|eukprot:XP_024577576.1 hypothetical protein PHALS_11570 [Plasmopara halstedii]